MVILGRGLFLKSKIPLYSSARPSWKPGGEGQGHDPPTVSRVTGLHGSRLQVIGAVGDYSVEYEGFVKPRFWGVT